MTGLQLRRGAGARRSALDWDYLLDLGRNDARHWHDCRDEDAAKSLTRDPSARR